MIYEVKLQKNQEFFCNDKKGLISFNLEALMGSIAVVGNWQGEAKGAAIAFVRLKGQFAPLLLNKLFADFKPYARTVFFVCSNGRLEKVLV